MQRMSTALSETFTSSHTVSEADLQEPSASIPLRPEAIHIFGTEKYLAVS